jgi:hypothetical protein
MRVATANKTQAWGTLLGALPRCLQSRATSCFCCTDQASARCVVDLRPESTQGSIQHTYPRYNIVDRTQALLELKSEANLIHGSLCQHSHAVSCTTVQ